MPVYITVFAIIAQFDHGYQRLGPVVPVGIVGGGFVVTQTWRIVRRRSVFGICYTFIHLCITNDDGCLLERASYQFF